MSLQAVYSCYYKIKGLPKAQIFRYQAEILCVYSRVNHLQLGNAAKGYFLAHINPTFIGIVLLDSLYEKMQFLTMKMFLFQTWDGNFL